jgi:hypothetical protein
MLPFCHPSPAGRFCGSIVSYPICTPISKTSHTKLVLDHLTPLDADLSTPVNQDSVKVRLRFLNLRTEYPDRIKTMHRTEPTDRPTEGSGKKSEYDSRYDSGYDSEYDPGSEDGTRNMTPCNRAPGRRTSREVGVGIGVGKKVGI